MKNLNFLTVTLAHMNPPSLPSPVLSRLRTLELTADHEPLLQSFFERNPKYFIANHGEPAQPTDAHEEIHGGLPPGWRFTKKMSVGYIDESGFLAAMATVISDLLAPSVWQIGLFIVETSLHGTGDSRLIYRGLESWMVQNGANWLRLAIVQGNVPAERFWDSCGYIQTRTRSGVTMGKQTNTLRVMVKPMTGGTVEEYLSLVQRDLPDAETGFN